MTPMPGFVKSLQGYDRSLRVRFARHLGVFFIERKLPRRQPQWLKEKPCPWGTTAEPESEGRKRANDLWESWQEGYVHVMSVHPDLLAWSLVAPELARCDMQRAGGFEKLNAELDAAEEAWEAEQERKKQTWLESASREAHDRLAWLEGRRVAVPEAVVDVVTESA